MEIGFAGLLLILLIGLKLCNIITVSWICLIGIYFAVSFGILLLALIIVGLYFLSIYLLFKK